MSGNDTTSSVHPEFGSGAGERPKRTFRSVYADRLPLWVFIGASVGIAIGLFFGDDAKLLRPVGAAYAMAMQIVVFPYIICSLLHGLGQLTPAIAAKLLRSSWAVYLVMWGATFFVILVMSTAIPLPPSPTFIDFTVPERSLDVLPLLIPADPFASLVQNSVPAIVVFSVLFGVAIQRVEQKQSLLQALDTIRKASVTIWGWVVMLAPIGVMALFADTAGTVRPDAAAQLSLYLVVFLCGTFFLAFWVLPSLIAAVCPITPLAVVRLVRDGLVIAMVTTLSVAALPFIQKAAERFCEEVSINDENRSEIARTTLAVAYPLAQLGNFFVLLFIVFGTSFFDAPLGWVQHAMMPLFTLLSGIGSPSSSIDTVNFLSHWVGLPGIATQLYIETMTVTRYGQVAASVMGFTFIVFVVILNYYGKLKISLPKLGLSVAVTIVVLGALSTAGSVIGKTIAVGDRSDFDRMTLGAELTDGVSVKVLAASAAPAGGPATGPSQTSSAPSHATALERIRHSGELRVGYNPDVVPFSFRNENGELVGFDIAHAYRLARDLNVALTLVPIEVETFLQDTLDGRYDVVAAAVYATTKRASLYGMSDPYFQSPIALIAQADQAEKWMSREDVAATDDLTIAVLDTAAMKEIAASLFPNATIVPLDNYGEMIQRSEIDATLTSLAEARAFARSQPALTAVVPRGLGGSFLFAYVTSPDNEELVDTLNYWLRLQHVSGFHARMVDDWINGYAPLGDGSPRWSIARNVLGWGERSDTP